jgi:hypothetical protein
MPCGETAQYTISSDTFTYGPEANGSNITVDASLATFEEVDPVWRNINSSNLFDMY